MTGYALTMAVLCGLSFAVLVVSGSVLAFHRSRQFRSRGARGAWRWVATVAAFFTLVFGLSAALMFVVILVQHFTT